MSLFRRVLQCERCGQQVAARSARWWDDDDYVELLQDYFALEAELNTARRELLRAQSALGEAREDIQRMQQFEDDHLWPLAQAQLRVLVALHPESTTEP